MKLPLLLFSLLISMCMAIAAVLVIPEPSMDEIIVRETRQGDALNRETVIETRAIGHGLDHPIINGMKIGGPGHARHARILWLGWLFGVLEILFFVGVLGLGLRKNGRLGAFKTPLIIGAGIMVAVFTALIVSYSGFMLDTPERLYGAFPAPTAVMMYVLWPAPLYFVVLYMVYFDRHVMTDQDMAKFEEIVRANRRRQEEGS